MAPLETLLTRSVQLATGIPGALPRPGQLMLAQDILSALVGKTGMAGIAPTGTGKSLAHMSAAALVAVQSHERTVISTDSLALQAQFMTKDLPVVAEAVREVFGFELDYAVLKGVSNYVDPVKALSLAQALLGSREKDFRRLIINLEKDPLQFKPEHPGEYSPKRQLAKLAAWALSVYLDDREHGDRDSCDVPHTTDDWRLVSASSDEKAKEEDLGYAPKADLAKEIAGDAHIVVTNHTLLGMQAARALPIVFGSKKLGRFHNLIVDEGHTLPGQVRSQGACEVSARVVMRAGRAASRVIDDRWIMEDTERLAEIVTQQLKNAVAHLPGYEDSLRVGPDDVGPIADIYEDIERYTSSVDDVLERAEKLSDEPKFQQKVRRARAAVQRLEDDAGVAIEPTSKIARWVKRGVDKLPPTFESSPVDVSPMINAQLWNIDPRGDLTKQEAEEWDRLVKDAEESEDGETPEMRVPLGVAVVSATLPAHFHIQVALPREAGEYESPFAEAYAGSALYIPRCLADQDIAALKNERDQKLKFDTFRHEAWCSPLISDLVQANGGRALVLAAKASSGKRYAEDLRRALPHLTILSQWDGGQVSRIVDAWRADEHSVLVGTKSLMTGVDAKGAGNSLVVIDRPPRAAKNVIDEARVEQLIERFGDRWVADRFVYVADAALLLEQSIGRLIRSVSDRGMVAILDPRLLSNQWSAFTYQSQTRMEFIRPVTKFGHKFNDLGRAKAWLENQHATQPVLA